MSMTGKTSNSDSSLRMTDRPVDARKATRAPLSIAVDMESENNFYAGVTGDISTGGVFVATYDPPAIGTVVEMVVALDGDRPLPLRGIVVWLRDLGRASSDSPAGCGLRWLDLPASAERAIRIFTTSRDTLLYDDE